MYLRKEVFEDT